MFYVQKLVGRTTQDKILRY